MNPNPAAPQNNRHHDGGYRSQAEVEEMLFGKGLGDVDMYGNPAQADLLIWSEDTVSNEPQDTTAGTTLDRRRTSRVPF